LNTGEFLREKFVDRYRGEIDGLRAIAIALVLLFHDTRYVPGGFVGVDVFFVISGYLITLHIIKEMDAGRFSLLSFYERRVRRIFPALLVMLFITLIAGWKLLLPLEFVDFAKSLLCAVLSVSNFYFWIHSDYFASAQLPLLHTWSLAVEEQFYLFFPAILVLLRRLIPRHFRSAVIVLASASFVLSAITVFRFPMAAFYLIPSRAWELLMGSMLAIGVLPKFNRTIVCELSSALGLAFILIAGFGYSSAMPFPGPTALLPCLGSVLIIAANNEKLTVVGKVLSTRPFVGLGLISYSLYLWHWPIIIFKELDLSFTFGKVAARLAPGLSPSQGASIERIIFTVVTSIIAAILSWKFVEQRFRVGPYRPKRRELFLAAAAASAVLIALSLSVVELNGFPARFSPRALKIASAAGDHKQFQRGTCFIATNDASSGVSDSCLLLDPAKKNVLLIGDSHGAQLYHGLSSEFPSIHILQATAVGCKGVIAARFGDTPKCRRIMESIFHDFLPRHRVDLVMLASRWESFDLNRIAATANYLQTLGLNVVVVGPTPRYDAPLARLLAIGVQSGREDLAASHRLRAYDDLDKQMARFASSDWHVGYILCIASVPKWAV
jgi:peptidoglycan/LPS O-acetylase OafA/YrhL